MEDFTGRRWRVVDAGVIRADVDQGFVAARGRAQKLHETMHDKHHSGDGVALAKDHVAVDVSLDLGVERQAIQRRLVERGEQREVPQGR